jgi:hypothetical protein
VLRRQTEHGPFHACDSSVAQHPRSTTRRSLLRQIQPCRRGRRLCGGHPPLSRFRSLLASRPPFPCSRCLFRCRASLRGHVDASRDVVASSPTKIPAGPCNNNTRAQAPSFRTGTLRNCEGRGPHDCETPAATQVHNAAVQCFPLAFITPTGEPPPISAGSSHFRARGASVAVRWISTSKNFSGQNPPAATG